MLVYSSTQHPSEMQHVVAHALGVAAQRGRRRVPAHGRRLRRQGDRSRRCSPASRRSSRAATAAGRSSCALDRDDDIHDHRQAPRLRHRLRGRLRRRRPDPRRRRSMLASRCGYLGRPVGPGQRPRDVATSTTPTTSPTSASSRYRCKTNTQSNTAFRGFGGPQGMIGDRARASTRSRATSDAIRSTCASANFYGTTERNVTPYGMTVEDNVIRRARRRARGDRPTTARGARRSARSTRRARCSSAASR